MALCVICTVDAIRSSSAHAFDSLITEPGWPGGGGLYAYPIGKHIDKNCSLILRWFLLGWISFERWIICRKLATRVIYSEGRLLLITICNIAAPCLIKFPMKSTRSPQEWQFCWVGLNRPLSVLLRTGFEPANAVFGCCALSKIKLIGMLFV